MPPRGQQINVGKDIRTLATDDYLFSEGSKGIVVHSHEGGNEAHYAHGEHPQMWGQGWDWLCINANLHAHLAEIKGQ